MKEGLHNHHTRKYSAPSSSFHSWGTTPSSLKPEGLVEEFRIQTLNVVGIRRDIYAVSSVDRSSMFRSARFVPLSSSTPISEADSCVLPRTELDTSALSLPLKRLNLRCTCDDYSTYECTTWKNFLWLMVSITDRREQPLQSIAVLSTFCLSPITSHAWVNRASERG